MIDADFWSSAAVTGTSNSNTTTNNTANSFGGAGGGSLLGFGAPGGGNNHGGGSTLDTFLDGLHQFTNNHATPAAPAAAPKAPTSGTASASMSFTVTAGGPAASAKSADDVAHDIIMDDDDDVVVFNNGNGNGSKRVSPSKINIAPGVGRTTSDLSVGAAGSSPQAEPPRVNILGAPGAPAPAFNPQAAAFVPRSATASSTSPNPAGPQATGGSRGMGGPGTAAFIPGVGYTGSVAGTVSSPVGPATAPSFIPGHGLVHTNSGSGSGAASNSTALHSTIAALSQVASGATIRVAGSDATPAHEQQQQQQQQHAYAQPQHVAAGQFHVTDGSHLYGAHATQPASAAPQQQQSLLGDQSTGGEQPQPNGFQTALAYQPQDPTKPPQVVQPQPGTAQAAAPQQTQYVTINGQTYAIAPNPAAQTAGAVATTTAAQQPMYYYQQAGQQAPRPAQQPQLYVYTDPATGQQHYITLPQQQQPAAAPPLLASAPQSYVFTHNGQQYVIPATAQQPQAPAPPAAQVQYVLNGDGTLSMQQQPPAQQQYVTYQMAAQPAAPQPTYYLDPTTNQLYMMQAPAVPQQYIAYQ